MTNNEQETTIVEMYDCGMSANAIRKELGTNIHKVLKILRSHGRKIKYLKYENIDIKQLKEDYMQVRSSRKLVPKYKCSHETILKLLKKNGVSTSRSKKNLDNETQVW